MKCPLEEIRWKRTKTERSNDLAVITTDDRKLAARAITGQKLFRSVYRHYDLRFLKPLDEELLHEVGRKFQRVLTIEDGIIKGGDG